MDINIIVTKEAAVEEGAIDLGIFDFSDHVDKNRVHFFTRVGGDAERCGNLGLSTK
jgi:hypothetical protein